MIEVTLITYLTGKTSAGSNVFAERPNEIPSEYILIDKTGSSVDNKIMTSTIAIQSVSDSMQNGSMFGAMSLNEEVKDAMDQYLDQAILGNLETVTIIHGFGTGAIRNAVQDYLKKCPYVKSYRYGGEGEGLNGATVVKLK